MIFGVLLCRKRNLRILDYRFQSLKDLPALFVIGEIR